MEEHRYKGSFKSLFHEKFLRGTEIPRKTGKQPFLEEPAERRSRINRARLQEPGAPRNPCSPTQGIPDEKLPKTMQNSKLRELQVNFLIKFLTSYDEWTANAAQT